MDFDGTLAEFTLDPSTVALPPSRQILLQTLDTRADLSAGIISGRRVADLRERVPSTSSMFLSGLHGLEIEEAGAAVRAQSRRARSARHQRARQGSPPRCPAALRRVRRGQDVTLFVLHVRGASTADRLHATTRFNALAEPLLSEGTVRLQPGDQVLELLPNVDWAKGDAVRAIMRHVEADTRETIWPVYIGDDETDEDAFEEIGTNGLTIAVGKRPAAAAFRVDDPAAVECFLRAILATE